MFGATCYLVTSDTWAPFSHPQLGEVSRFCRGGSHVAGARPVPIRIVDVINAILPETCIVDLSAAGDGKTSHHDFSRHMRAADLNMAGPHISHELAGA